MSAYIIPVIFLVVLLLSFLRRREPYGGFIDGARQAVDLTINVFPYLLAVMVAVEAFRVSGASAYLADMLAPVLEKTVVKFKPSVRRMRLDDPSAIPYYNKEQD